MTEPDLPSLAETRRLDSPSGLHIELLPHGAIQRIGAGAVCVNAFVGNAVEGGPANLWLRVHGADGIDALPLLGPRSPLSPCADGAGFEARGVALGLQLRLQLRLAESTQAWFWHLDVINPQAQPCCFDLVFVQDIALSSPASIRLNEHYVSHYVDLTPLQHARQGWVLAARQNLAVAGCHPWALFGALGRSVQYATDALQWIGLAGRSSGLPAGLAADLPSRRLQHEHALVALQHEQVTLAPGAATHCGFFGRLLDDHAEATSVSDLDGVDATLALPEAQPAPSSAFAAIAALPRSLFATAPLLPVLDLDDNDLDTLFGSERRHEERDDGCLLSFFHGDATHVVLRAKERLVQRPHGHILRGGSALVPDETALTSTVWMGGVFHSMLTQGHVSINRLLSTVRGWLGQFRSQGQRVFVQLDGRWQQLGVPSAFEIEPTACRWIYRHHDGLFTVRSRTVGGLPAMALEVEVLQGPTLPLLITHHIALAGDDGSGSGAALWQWQDDGVHITAPLDSDVGRRFPAGDFVLQPAAGSRFLQVTGDERLFDDGRTQQQAFVCMAAEAAPLFGMQLVGGLLDANEAPPIEPALRLPSLLAPASATADVACLADVMPWFGQNALVHYLAPRGLEQYSGGGWGTRDVCQGPLELLLALDRPAPVRDLLLRVFRAQNADGDWPQWFMFFDRERDIRAGDSHGDIVFWPLLGLARYLLASGDGGLLDQPLPFHDEAAPSPLWSHVERALALIAARRISGTRLAAYGHGDWNDSLQPADPSLREHLCSAWTVTLHHQMLTTLAQALRALGRQTQANPLAAEAAAVRADFQRWLVVDGVVTGYAQFPPGGGTPTCLLHPSDRSTGLQHSLLPMMHAILENLFSAEQAQAHRRLIERHLTGPDGARLFDRPMAYRGGPERFFQRAESSAFFGREIGVMYMHAHVRYAEMLAHLGDAPALQRALGQVHALGLRERVPQSDLRQSNCYFSSSDAAFADRYEALDDYGRIAAGSVRLDGGWRIYSSGPGIALATLVGRWLGIRCSADTLVIDPVLAPSLDGLRARLQVAGHEIELHYRVGPAGCGPTWLELDGQTLPFRRGSNPYRIGAAEVERAEFLQRFATGSNPRPCLTVFVG